MTICERGPACENRGAPFNCLSSDFCGVRDKGCGRSCVGTARTKGHCFKNFQDGLSSRSLRQPRMQIMDEQQQPPYEQVPPYQQPPQYAAPPQAAGEGLSDNAAAAIAYLTIIPAIIFLVMEPYNRKPFIKFNAFQCLGLAVVGFVVGFVNIIPILGQIIFLVVMLGLLVMWVMCIINASQGKVFKVPVIGNFAAQQAGL